MNYAEWVIPGAVFGLGSTIFLLGIFVYLYARERTAPLRWLSVGWGFYGVRFILEVVQTVGSHSRFLDAGIEILVTVSSFAIVTGTRLLFARPIRRWTVAGGALVMVLALVSMLFLSNPVVGRAASVATFVYSAALFIWVGGMFLQLTVTERVGGRTTGALFLIWGLHKLDYPFLHDKPAAAAWGYLLAALLGMGTAISIILHYLEIQRRNLERSEDRSRLLSHNARDLVFRYTAQPKPHFDYVSPSVETLTGYAPEELYSNPDQLLSAVPEEDKPVLHSALSGREHGPGIFRVHRRDGGIVWLELLVSAVLRSDGTLEALEGIARDVTSRISHEAELRQRREQLQQAVDERDELLQELHHRVNNNLSIILSLLEFERREYGESAEPLIRKIQRRVMSIALVHSLLYRSGQVRRLDFHRYCSELVERLVEVRPESRENASVELDITAVSLEIETVKTCGLIVTELVDNAFEHAFVQPSESRGVVKIAFHPEEGDWLLVVEDNGVGLTIGRHSQSPIGSGLHLVRTLCEELDARLRLETRNGVRAAVRFSGAGR